MQDGVIGWTQASVAGVPLQRFVARVGEVEVGAVEYDGPAACGRGRARSWRTSGATRSPRAAQSAPSKRGCASGSRTFARSSTARDRLGRARNIPHWARVGGCPRTLLVFPRDVQ